MELTHRFHVPSDLDTTWTHFQDVAGIAGCFPGAQVTSAEGDEFTGSCKVKLGPIALVYNGSGVFAERNEQAHRLVVTAKGKDKRGNGTAAATAALTLAEAPSGGTDVEVVTDLAITGKPAQFGRGLFQDVSDKLLGQFVACLERQLSAGPAADLSPEGPEAGAGSGAAPGPGSGAGPEASSGLSAGAAAGTTPTPGTAPTAGARPEAARLTSVPPRTEPVPPSPEPEALDLGATVLPILLRHYWKPVAAGVVSVLILIRLIRRR